jgi:hypothetical protein
VLSTLAIPVEWRRLQDSSNSSSSRDEPYLRSLVPQLLSRSAGDLSLALEYCDHYAIEEAFPCLLYVEQQLSQQKAGPLDVAYQVRAALSVTLSATLALSKAVAVVDVIVCVRCTAQACLHSSSGMLQYWCLLC